jgi:hypothetical protein
VSLTSTHPAGVGAYTSLSKTCKSAGLTAAAETDPTTPANTIAIRGAEIIVCVLEDTVRHNIKKQKKKQKK